MKIKLLLNILFVVLVSSFLACELIADKSPSMSNSLNNACDIKRVTQVFPAEDGKSGNTVGNYSKDFSYTCDDDGTSHKLSDLRDEKVVLIKFWRRYCETCETELANLNNLHTAYSNNGLLTLGMNVGTDKSDTDVDSVVAILNKKGCIFPNAYMGSIYAQGITGSVPYYILIDKDGIIRYVGETLPAESTIANLLNP